MISSDVARQIRAADLAPNEKLLLWTMASYANAALECWPSLSTIAADMGVQKRWAQRLRKAVEDRGYLVVVAKKPGSSNHYQIRFPEAPAERLGTTPEDLPDNVTSGPADKGQGVIDETGDRKPDKMAPRPRYPDKMAPGPGGGWSPDHRGDGPQTIIIMAPGPSEEDKEEDKEEDREEDNPRARAGAHAHAGDGTDLFGNRVTSQIIPAKTPPAKGCRRDLINDEPGLWTKLVDALQGGARATNEDKYFIAAQSWNEFVEWTNATMGTKLSKVKFLNDKRKEGIRQKFDEVMPHLKDLYVGIASSKFLLGIAQGRDWSVDFDFIWKKNDARWQKITEGGYGVDASPGLPQGGTSEFGKAAATAARAAEDLDGYIYPWDR